MNSNFLPLLVLMLEAGHLFFLQTMASLKSHKFAARVARWTVPVLLLPLKFKSPSNFPVFLPKRSPVNHFKSGTFKTLNIVSESGQESNHMSNHQRDDLDLLLSLQDRVLETPPSSPSSHKRSPGYSSDDGTPKKPNGDADMSVFKNAVQDCMDYDAETAKKTLISNRSKTWNDPELEKFSGLRIRNQVISPAEMSNHFSDIRFVRLSAIKNLIKGDTLTGCWATVGVLTEKGSPKTSSTGKNYCIWKIGSLDGQSVSVFLFGDAYQKYCKESAGTVFAFFNSGLRNDTSGIGFSLSVYTPGQILKMGTSVDYGVCKGRKKGGVACTMVINKRCGIYCSYHRSKASEKYCVTRTELKGGNLRTAFRDPFRSEGIYLVDPLADKTNIMKPKQPTKLLSVERLKKALSNADKVTTNVNSQGIRFLTEITGSMDRRTSKKESAFQNHLRSNSLKRSPSTSKLDSSLHKTSPQAAPKRSKTGDVEISSEKFNKTSEKVIELDVVSSDDEACFIFR
ncbi:hypothetical protein Nepgr_004804 [Nepenthes gracilis]|uniref:Zinc finger Mcm10/DnaG-type domain-containing protein n=1 Tax=Nepenthes gracilis TaxID=150966 RepID=A0AAD3S224_NEPGR|nr:hypothetical protein Nepgr_004804 [Nepenthes gracilis]